MDKKPLYLSNNFAELQKLADTSKLDINNVKNACHLLEKLYEKHEQAYLERDEELAYVYIMRFLESFTNARKLFKTDIKYINAIINGNKVTNAFTRAENLKSTLKERYDIHVQNKTVKESKEEAVLKVIDSEKDNQKGVVTCKYVYNHLKSGSDQMLIVDTRSRADFEQCHISGKFVINIPSDQLHAGCSIVDVNKLLKKVDNESHAIAWKERTTKTLVILTDWEMRQLDGLNLVKDAIYKWDAEKRIKEPVLLENGLKSFLMHYPTMCTNARYKGPSDETMSATIKPGDINYPNWEAMDNNRRLLEEEAHARMLTDIGNKRSEIKSKINSAERTVTDHSPERNVQDHSLEQNTKDKHADSAIESSQSEVVSLIVDRSLKPEIVKDKPSVDHTKGLNTTNSPNVGHKVHSLKVDRTLKPEGGKDTSKNDAGDPINNAVTTPKPLPLRRLSSNSRTDQDRSDFAARGGAKAIPPPTEDDKTKLPPWISREFDAHTNEYYYLDRKNNKRYTTMPDNVAMIASHGTVPSRSDIDTRKEAPRAYVDRVEVLKDHSHTSKQMSTSSSMKRSTSQPNLTEEAVVDTKSVTVVDRTDLVSSHGSRDVPRLDRHTKPSHHSKSFNEFSASRLNSFNPTYRNVTPGLTGLRNMGNTCYMNSVIQALSNTHFLANYILTDSYLHDININNPLGYKGELVREFALLTKALWKGQYKEISPADFKRMVDSKNEMFRGGEQHDSQEFLLFLLDGLHEDQNSGKRQTASVDQQQQPGDNDHQLTDVDRATLSWNAHLAINDSVIVRMFQGQYRSKVTCDHCLASSVTFDAFMYLSLPLVTSHTRCSLDECIKLFLAEEKMTGASQWFCPKCKTNRNARKKIDIWKLPPYLLIHLKRFSCSGQYREKLNTFVDFPMETLSLSDILSHTIQPHKHDAYHLYAVSNHHGNMESGHYTSYCKNAKEGAWYNYDDDLVTRIKEADVKTPSAYILFYESYNLKKALFTT